MIVSKQGNIVQLSKMMGRFLYVLLVCQDCSDFLAGSALRSAVRYKALDETVMFGYACRHEFPQAFVNLKHGER